MLSTLILSVLLVGSAVLSYRGTRALRSWAFRSGRLLDRPNARSNHRVSTVRGGGLVFAGLALIGWVLGSHFLDVSYGYALSLAALLVGLVGLLDDLYGIGIVVRLMAQVAAACIFLSAISVPVFFNEMGPMVGPILWFASAIFFIVSVTNIYNFMDGADGLTALHSVIVLLGWGWLAVRSEDAGASLMISGALLAPLVGFLVLNWNPARIFMGDVGSTFLGFTFATLAIVQFPGVLRSSTFSLVILMMLPFLFDASFTILQRLISGKRWYMAHTDHLFQRLLRKGHSHGRVALIYASITVVLAGVGLATEHLLIGEYTATLLCCLPLLALYTVASLPPPRNLRELARDSSSQSQIVSAYELSFTHRGTANGELSDNSQPEFVTVVRQ